MSPFSNDMDQVWFRVRELRETLNHLREEQLRALGELDRLSDSLLEFVEEMKDK